MAVKKSELYASLWAACDKLRGGVEPAKYKDYVLLLLFFKYASDKYRGQKNAPVLIPEGASFDDLILLKGKSNIGEETDKKLAAFLEANGMTGMEKEVSFNDPEKLGKGKDHIDRVSDLIGVFQNPALDFSKNRASGDDIMGDAYEYFMKKFAQESRKSKGQFYTPGEVSRVIARLIGIGSIRVSRRKDWTLYDPACGSGSLLIRAADEASVDREGEPIVSIFGQEIDGTTAKLAQMNMIIHHKETAEIQSGNTLSDPAFYIKKDVTLRTFDFIVMNPPFSDKHWTSGVNVEGDSYGRFQAYGATPPPKNGDYAWFEHVLKSLNATGKAGIVLPLGVLFRGNAEEVIRKDILAAHSIKGVVALPGNLFYGTGIPACIVLIDKEGTTARKGIFLIDASHGYKKDGNKNRLREQDIERIVRTYAAQQDVPGYARMVSYEEIFERNDGNLNITRYVQHPDDTLPQNIAAHLSGGIPKNDVESLEKLWQVAPQLKGRVFKKAEEVLDAYHLVAAPEAMERMICEDADLRARKQMEEALMDAWEHIARPALLSIRKDTVPKALIRRLTDEILKAYAPAQIIDPYTACDILLNYWNETLHDDVDILRVEGYEAGRLMEPVYAKTKQKDGKTKVISFEGVLISKDILAQEYYADDVARIAKLEDEAARLAGVLDEMQEDGTGEDGLLNEVASDNGKITKSKLKARRKELAALKTSPALEVLQQLLALLAEKKPQAKLDACAKRLSTGTSYDLCNKNGTYGKKKIQDAIKAAQASAEIPEAYREEYEAVEAYAAKCAEKEEKEDERDRAVKDLEDKLEKRYPQLTVEEIQHLLFDCKWMKSLRRGIADAIDLAVNRWSERTLLIAKRYEHTLGELEARAEASRKEMKAALGRMGYTW